MLPKEPSAFRVRVCPNCYPSMGYFSTFGTCGWKHKMDACWRCGFNGRPKIVIVKKGDPDFNVYLSRWKNRLKDAK